MVDLFGYPEDGAKKPRPARKTARRGSPAPRDEPGGTPEKEVFTVSSLTRKIRNLLEMRVGEVWVEGEISNLRVQASGHQYFTLKDSGAQISCVLFRGNARHLAAPLSDGMEVQLFGEVSVYEPRGNYQIIARSVQEKGVGALQAKFEALKRKLDAEGLFAADRKKPIPRFPRTVCLVTSPTGAALQDMLNIFERRAPWLRILLYPVRVQGGEAAGEIAAALRHLAAVDNGLPEIDTIVLGRGGGSLEDLWPFNEEVVARAVEALEIPVVSAVGHEIDFTISDFTADLRAPTPSAAAELVAPDGDELRARLGGMEATLKNRVSGAVERWEERLEYLGRSALLREPARVLAEREQEVDWKAEGLSSALREALAEREEELGELRHRLALGHPLRKLEAASGRFELLSGQLQAACETALKGSLERVSIAAAALKNLGPDAVLSRGYSLTLDADGEVVRSADGVTKGDRLVTKLAEGEVESVVD